MSTLTVRLPDDTHERLKELARHRVSRLATRPNLVVHLSTQGHLRGEMEIHASGREGIP